MNPDRPRQKKFRGAAAPHPPNLPSMARLSDTYSDFTSKVRPRRLARPRDARPEGWRAVLHYGLSFPAFTRSGVRIRRNLCIREGVRIHTRCVYTLPLAYTHLPVYTHPGACIHPLRIRTQRSRIRTYPAYTHPCLHPPRIRTPACVYTPTCVYAPWGVRIRHWYTHVPAYTHPHPRTSKCA